MKELDLTKGSVFTVLLKFATPFLLANLLQALYGGADLLVVGQFSDSIAVSAVAIGSQIMQSITGALMGITTGVTVLIAIATGARNEKEMARVIGSSVWLFSFIGLLLTASMLFFARDMVQWIHTPAESAQQTYDYLWVCSAGIFFIVGYNSVCGVLRGMGDSKTPLYFVAIACAINIILDIVLVKYFAMGAKGAAFATITSQGVSFILALLYLAKRGFSFKFRKSDFRPSRIQSGKVLKLGAPIALQDLLVNLSFLIITAIVNGMGVIASASLGVVEKLIVFFMLPPMAFAAAVSTMTAQNHGAGLAKRAYDTLFSGIGTSLCFGVTVCVYSQFFPTTLTAIFSSDPEVIRMAADYLRSFSFDCILVCIVFCVNAFFSGRGNSLFPMVHSLIATFLVRIPVSYLMSVLYPDSLYEIGLAAPLSTLVSIAICAVYMVRENRATLRKADKVSAVS